MLKVHVEILSKQRLSLELDLQYCPRKLFRPPTRQSLDRKGISYFECKRAQGD